MESSRECGIEPSGSINHGVRPTGRRHLGVGLPRRRWEYNIRMDLKEIGTNTRT